MSRVVLTYRDYATLPNDGRRYEIHTGTLSVTPTPSPRHQAVSINLASALHVHVSSRRLGRVFTAPIDVILSDTTVVQPDLVYVATDRLGRISERGIEGAPTLVVEILSPSTIETDRHTKREIYARHGIPWFWIVDPESRQMEISALVAGEFAVTTRATRHEAFSAEPFAELVILPAALWA